MTIKSMLPWPARGLGQRIPANIIRHKEIEETIIIHIDPSSSDRPHFSVGRVDSSQARFFGDILKSSVTLVAVKKVSVYAGDKQIDKAVVIVVCGGRAHGITLAGQTGFFGDVREGTIAIVSEKPVVVFGRIFF